jgi:hypothetical protein
LRVDQSPDPVGNRHREDSADNGNILAYRHQSRPSPPTRDRDSIGFLFRAGRIGYGVSTQMARRCLERLDEEHIDGSVTVLRVLSDTHPVASQGSSWIVAGKVL